MPLTTGMGVTADLLLSLSSQRCATETLDPPLVAIAQLWVRSATHISALSLCSTISTLQSRRWLRLFVSRGLLREAFATAIQPDRSRMVPAG